MNRREAFEGGGLGRGEILIEGANVGGVLCSEGLLPRMAKEEGAFVVGAFESLVNLQKMFFSIRVFRAPISC